MQKKINKSRIVISNGTKTNLLLHHTQSKRKMLFKLNEKKKEKHSVGLLRATIITNSTNCNTTTSVILISNLIKKQSIIIRIIIFFTRCNIGFDLNEHLKHVIMLINTDIVCMLDLNVFTRYLLILQREKVTEVTGLHIHIVVVVNNLKTILPFHQDIFGSKQKYQKFHYFFYVYRTTRWNHTVVCGL